MTDEMPIEQVRSELKAAGIDMNSPQIAGKLLKKLADAHRQLAAAKTEIARLSGPPVTDREHLGRLVRSAWVQWAYEQPVRKAHWLTAWEDLPAPEREVDRRIGERIAARATTLTHRQLGAVQDQLAKAQADVQKYFRASRTNDGIPFSQLCGTYVMQLAEAHNDLARANEERQRLQGLVDENHDWCCCCGHWNGPNLSACGMCTRTPQESIAATEPRT